MVAALRHLLLWTRPTEAGSRIFTHFTATERYPKTVEQLCVVTQLAKVKENVLGHRTVSDGIIGIVRDQDDKYRAPGLGPAPAEFDQARLGLMLTIKQAVSSRRWKARKSQPQNPRQRSRATSRTSR